MPLEAPSQLATFGSAAGSSLIGDEIVVCGTLKPSSSPHAITPQQTSRVQTRVVVARMKFSVWAEGARRYIARATAE
jgi:hypothetical protein